MTYSAYPQGFPQGVTIRGVPLLQAQPGSVYWLNNGTVFPDHGTNGSDGNRGTYIRPFKTLSAASAACTAGRGDIIMVMPGHAEAISSATALTMAKAGVAVIGLGTGGSRPTFTFNTANTATINVTAANVIFKNCIFIANFLAIATCFTLTTATDFGTEECVFRDTSSVLNFVNCVKTDTTNNHADGLYFCANRVEGLGTSASTTVLIVRGNLNRIQVDDNFVVLALLNNTVALLAHGANLVTNLSMGRNKVFRPNTDTSLGAILISTSSALNTGHVFDNYVRVAETAALSLMVTAGAAYGTTNNLSCGDANASGFVHPAIGTH